MERFKVVEEKESDIEKCYEGKKMMSQVKIGVVIPCYKVKEYILDVLSKIGSEVTHIYCVDDACPQSSGLFISENVADCRIKIIYHKENEGVGGAVISGYKAALQDGVDVIVKLDGDGQMDPALIARMIYPVVSGEADYAKGDRFYKAEYLKQMPAIRKAGNAFLSFMNKFSSGYWQIFDPTNGFTAISASVARELPFERISKRYFFESDVLFQLGLLRAVVRDVPIKAVYQGEVSSLKIGKILFEFITGHLYHFMVRVLYNYFIRNFTLGSIELVFALLFILFGLIVGGVHWTSSIMTGVTASAGTVMLSALPIMLGFQLVLAFFSEDISLVPKIPVSKNNNSADFTSPLLSYLAEAKKSSKISEIMLVEPTVDPQVFVRKESD
ncbi:MAG TPA: glycosyltransferase family 2 protein [Chitinispirillaceae bacterium]|nr:glycosyltransferase family 2 protein [Chitinispirillaceae bacterium]